MSGGEKGAPVTYGSFTCESCGRTFPKGWSDEESAAEAQENFPGIDISDPAESGLVCDDCYRHIMGRAQVEAPELIGPGWRDGEQAASADPIGDALRADAEAARAEIRGAGIVCPSCGTNMADLPDGHMLVVFGDEEGLARTAECRDGVPARLAGISSPMSDAEFAAWQSVGSLLVWDAFRRREAEMFEAVIGPL